MSLVIAPDTCALTGYVEQTFVQYWMDGSGNQWRKVTTVVNLGRADSFVPDPDALLEPEPWLDEIPLPTRDPDAPPDNRGNAGRIGHQRSAIERHERTERVLIDYLTRNGPCGIWRLCSATGRKYDWMKMHLEARENRLYCRVRKEGKATIWGICDKETP